MLERYQDNLKDKLIEVDGKKLYVIDQITYDGKIYVYTFNAEKYEQTDELEINIFEKKDVDELIVVTDMNLFDKVLASIGSKVIAEEVKKLNLNGEE